MTTWRIYDIVYNIDGYNYIPMKTINLTTILQNLGLNEKEAKVYLACLELGSATVQEVSDKAGVKRTSVYNFLEDMKARGFITEVKHGKKILLTAEDPRVLLKKADEQKKQFEEMLPEFLSIYNLPSEKPKVKFYQGVEGLKRIYEDTLNEGATIYEISDYERMFETIELDWMWNYPKRRTEKNIKAFSIAKEGVQAQKVRAKDAEHLRETRFIKDVNFETEINIYGDKIALLSFRRPYAGVIIEDRAIAQTLRSMWNIIWNQAK
ncbi:MAG: Transcriptional regulator, TrmB [Candidatus Magasanikbacteria bacterium GW2011_GWC2_40_17]|uniref:Transcriptional regulator, TrmB n=1 Tax=Candidatus Magasanikbacteria bacterium GW2011_GWA2_42_32 TaxID=1619039 RepID=A0A0G1C690_9BACT|nr:MAG: Transcriptional regulator, TrmB [Candidatus Magasanikbacteria bacterium GW2011_GWC2_40_17]KKS54181.1 MAG: Transcriptional regulator, TrmB [Candidatus Magasanikbacteria bacterium GW2011_GWA2_42_32]